MLDIYTESRVSAPETGCFSSISGSIGRDVSVPVVSPSDRRVRAQESTASARTAPASRDTPDRTPGPGSGCSLRPTAPVSTPQARVMAITVMPSAIRPTGRRVAAPGARSQRRTIWRAASTIATHRKGISISSAICTPSRGTRSGTRIMPRTKPVPNTRAKQTAPALTISMAYLFAIRPVSSRAMPNPSSNISTPPAAYTASYPAATATCPPITGPSPWPT